MATTDSDPAPVQHSAAKDFALGRDMGPAGRVFRLITGVLGLLLLYYRLPHDGSAYGHVLWMLGSFAAVAAAFIVVYGLLRDRFIGRVNPWITAGLLQAPILVYPFDIGPAPFHDALAMYTSLSLLLNVVIGYGGLEVAALPSLVWGRRHPLYSPFNAVDIAERAFAHRPRTAAGRALWAAAALVTAFVFVGFWLIDYVVFLPALVESGVGAAIRPPGPWAVVLLLPAAYLALDARRRRAEADALPGPGARFQALAAVFLTLATPAFMADMVPEVLWIAVIAGGLITAVATLVTWPLRRRSSG
ncbi:DUF6410 domain-containing protein [Nocardiopsis sediminis]|uniref:DUF6410 domain-containing protein n=1 Tax=Nocardiopsis sediminis TaxID=1778267 RepID=A0ABV8FSS4_9ACTN